MEKNEHLSSVVRLSAMLAVVTGAGASLAVILFTVAMIVHPVFWRDPTLVKIYLLMVAVMAASLFMARKRIMLLFRIARGKKDDA